MPPLPPALRPASHPVSRRPAARHLLLVLPLLLAACFDHAGERLTNRIEPTAVRQDFAHQVDFAGVETRLTQAELADLRVFLDIVRPGQGDFFVLSAAAGPLEGERVAATAALLAEAYPAVELGARTGLVPAGQVEVLLVRHEALVPGCPDWRRPEFGLLDARATSNFGCATAENLAAMLVDPRDLVRGRGTTIVEGDRAAQAVGRLRAPPLQAEQVEGPGDSQTALDLQDPAAGAN